MTILFRCNACPVIGYGHLTRSQDLEPAYHDAGQFYWGRTDAFLEDRHTFSGAALPIILPHDRVQDIDTEEDWIKAECLMKYLLGQGAH